MVYHSELCGGQKWYSELCGGQKWYIIVSCVVVRSGIL